MLRITHSTNGSGAAKYFDEGLQRGDYYATSEHSIGEWSGQAAERLGLSGEVKKEDFVALCHNQKPDGSKLNPRHSDKRKVGYDLTFSVPKSVSLAYAVKGDQRISKAFKQSVEETMREIEANMRTQTGQGKQKQHIKTGEMIWAGFTHRTSRPVDGIPDPHLHRHCFAFNTTWNKDKGRFQAGEFGEIKKTAPYYEAAFHARMAMKMQRLGYRVERRGYSWEIKGIENGTLEKFSRRTLQVEEKARLEKIKNGALSAKQKDKLGALTRTKKLVGRSWETLQQVWRSWINDNENKQLKEIGHDANINKQVISAKEAVNRAQEHLFERKSVVPNYQLKAEALKRAYGDVLPEQVQSAIDHGEFYQKEIKGRHYITTRQAVQDEYTMLQRVRQSKGKHLPLNADYIPKADYLNEQQRAAIKHALTDTNGVTLIAGSAGTGKTTLMKEVRDGIEQSGKKMMGFAPSAAASRGVLRSEGFKDADTLAQLLHNPKLQEQVKGQVIWVDEAGLIGNKDMNQLLNIADKQQARLLLTGDYRQHSSVAAGDALRILEQEAKLPVARVHKIQRQRDNALYKRAVSLASEGKGDAALYQLDRMGDIIEVTNGKERLEQLVKDYTTTVKAKHSALIVSPTHLEGQDVTETLRARLKEKGLLGPEEHRFLQLKNTNWTEEHKKDAFHYQQSNLALEFHQNSKGHVRGERWKIKNDEKTKAGYIDGTDSSGKKQVIDLSQAKRFTLYQQKEINLAKGDKVRITKGGKTREGIRINNGDLFTIKGFTREGHIQLHTGRTLPADFGHIAHGYVTTSHSSQGKTVDHVFIAQSSQSVPASSKQQFYVSISRGREQCRIYTDDKKALEQAVKQDSQRMTARQVAEHNRKKIRQKTKPKITIKESSKHYRYDRGKSL
jgi:conjugative relaxase-like TrwC/TraI family protein